MNVQELRKADEARGWSEIPDGCPTVFVNAICEKRAVSIATNKPIPMPSFLQRVVRSIAPVFRPRRMSETLEQKAARQALQIRRDAFFAAPSFKAVYDANGNHVDNAPRTQAEHDDYMRRRVERLGSEIRAEQERISASEPITPEQALNTQWSYVGRAKE
jgi:hypothetical protein